MKIKQKNTGIVMYTSLVSVVVIFSLVRGVVLDKNYFNDLSLKGWVSLGIFLVIVLYLFIGSMYGSYIEVTEEYISRVEGYETKKLLFKGIRRIYCSHHVFLGPSMFLEYKENDVVSLKEVKLFTLNSYSQEDKKAFLDLLAEKHPNIQQDHNCEKIRAGEKVLTTWK